MHQPVENSYTEQRVLLRKKGSLQNFSTVVTLRSTPQKIHGNEASPGLKFKIHCTFIMLKEVEHSKR